MSKNDDSASPPENIIPSSLAESTTESGSSQQQVAQKQDKQKKHFSPTDKMRLVILCIAVLFVITGILVYIKTGNAQLLLSTSVLAYPIYKIVDYYFDKNERQK
jgi:cell division protein FtsL